MKRGLSHREFVQWAAYKVFMEAEWNRVTNNGKNGELLDVW